LVAGTAKALEQCLLGLEERGAPLPLTAQPVLARAIAGLHALAARVRSRAAFDAGDEAEGAEIAAELEVLRNEAAPAAIVQDSESFAERAAVADEAHDVSPILEAPRESALESVPVAPVVVLTPPVVRMVMPPESVLEPEVSSAPSAPAATLVATSSAALAEPR